MIILSLAWAFIPLANDSAVQIATAWHVINVCKSISLITEAQQPVPPADTCLNSDCCHVLTLVLPFLGRLCPVALTFVLTNFCCLQDTDRGQGNGGAAETRDAAS